MDSLRGKVAIVGAADTDVGKVPDFGATALCVEAARRALTAGFDRESVNIGCGATIPFVGPFVEVLGGAPALLLGLEDPPCNAHGENESLDLDDFRKSAKSSAHLFAELAFAMR